MQQRCLGRTHVLCCLTTSSCCSCDCMGDKKLLTEFVIKMLRVKSCDCETCKIESWPFNEIVRQIGAGIVGFMVKAPNFAQR